jgi:hypothetical protein
MKKNNLNNSNIKKKIIPFIFDILLLAYKEKKKSEVFWYGTEKAKERTILKLSICYMDHTYIILKQNKQFNPW